jgi:inorganic pyrophosphatase
MHFFTVYKQLERKQTDVQSLSGRENAIKIINDAITMYGKSFQGK